MSNWAYADDNDDVDSDLVETYPLGNKPYTPEDDELDDGELRGEITIYHRWRVKGDDSEFGGGWRNTDETFTNSTLAEALAQFKEGMVKYEYVITGHAESYRYE